MADGDERVVGRANDDIDTCEALQTSRSPNNILKCGDRVFRHQIADRATAVVLSRSEEHTSELQSH